MKLNFVKNYIYFLLLASFLVSVVHQSWAGLVASFSDQLSSHAISTGANHTITFTLSSDINPNQTLELYFENSFDLSRIDFNDVDFMDDGTNKNLAVSPGNGVGGSIGTAVSNQSITFVQNDTDTISAGSIITIMIGTNSSHQTLGNYQIYNPDLAGNYYVSISGTFGDLGSVAVPILSTDSVGFTATVEPSLSFSLRNADDSDFASACEFNSLTLNTISECSYRLAAETNNFRGFQVFIASDGHLRNGNDIISEVEAGTPVTPGTEGFGLSVIAGDGINEDGNFNTDDSPVPVENLLLISSNSVYNYIAGEFSTSSLITFKLAISKLTKPGNYGRQIIFSILGNY